MTRHLYLNSDTIANLLRMADERAWAVIEAAAEVRKHHTLCLGGGAVDVPMHLFSEMEKALTAFFGVYALDGERA